MKGDWIQTYSGKKFYFLDMHEDMICIEDIAHHLAICNRFSGASKWPYNVAQHSVIGSYIPPLMELQYEFLFHDAHEAYFGDMSRPLKRSTPLPYMAWWREKTEECQRLINKKFQVGTINSPEVKFADERMLLTERRDLLTYIKDPWIDKAEPLPTKIVPWAWDEAEQRFLIRFWQLQGALGLGGENAAAHN